MASFLIIILVFLWLTGIISIPSFSILHLALFHVNGKPVTIWDILILAVILWVVGILPLPFRGLGTILLILWLLSILGIIAIAGFSNLIIILLLIGLIIHLFGVHFN